jgi:LPS-assembly protein
MPFIISIFFIFILAFRSQANPLGGVTLTADESRQNITQKSVELIGNVRVTFKDQILTAQYARVDFIKKTLFATGQVKVTNQDTEIMGEEALFDIENGSGFIQNGVLKSGSIYFEGRTLFRTENNEYVAENGKYTTCLNCPETWSFISERIRAQLGGYAYMKNLTLRFGGVPVFWMPYLIVPLKSERQTGLLTPEIEASAIGGMTLTQSFFWAPSQSQDFLFSLKNYELRGLKGLFNYRYMLDNNSWGELNFATISDRTTLYDKRFRRFNRNKDSDSQRWFIKYEHYYELPENFIHRAQFNNASDLQYPTDFPLETRNQGDSAMESRTSLTKNSDSFHSSIELAYYINMLEADPKASNNSSVHRLPDIRFSKISSPILDTGWRYQWDLTYTQFARTNFSYDNINRAYSDNLNLPPRQVETIGNLPACNSNNWYQFQGCQPTFDGEFNPDRDLIRSGQRIDALAQFYKTFETEYFNMTPRISMRNQNYQFDIENLDSANRMLLRAEIAARTQLSSIISENIRHVIEPELTFVTIPHLVESQHPFFGDSAKTPYSINVNISDQDLNSPWGLQFDYTDRIFDRKVMIGSITNRWIQKNGSNNTSQNYRTLAIWRLSQSYDFYQEQINSSKRQPLSDLNSELIINFNRLHLYQRAVYFPYYNLANTSTRLHYDAEDNSYYELGHLRSYNITLGQPVKTSQRIDDLIVQFKKQFSRFSVIARGTYDTNLQNDTGGTLKSYGIAGQIKLPGDCWYLTITQYRIQRGDSISTFNFDFVWDPKQTPTVPESFLRQIGF